MWFEAGKGGCRPPPPPRGGGGGAPRVRGDGRRQVNKTFSISTNFNYKSVRYVRPTEYTQSGNGNFLVYISITMENSAQLGVGGGRARPTPFHYIYHHEQSCGVRSRFFPYEYSVVRPLIPIAPLPFCVSGRD
jgi:hypothetical protein